MPRGAVATGIQSQFASLATSLAGQAGLRGVVGVEAIVERDGRVAVLEVNPRPTASAELVERTTGESILAMHLAAFGLASPVAPPAAHDAGIWSKAVLFAAEPIAIDDRMLSRLHALAGPWTAADRLPAIADIPCPGQVLRGGGPVLTVFARGDTGAASVAELRSRVEAVKTVTG
jgi:predicted ATP-grasp superfamily ATP-dependent carboligase